MVKKLTQPAPPPSIIIPAHTHYLLVLARSRSMADAFVAKHKNSLIELQATYHIFFYPEDVMIWRDRSMYAHLVVLETPSDPTYFREEVGRVALFFPSKLILKVTH